MAGRQESRLLIVCADSSKCAGVLQAVLLLDVFFDRVGMLKLNMRVGGEGRWCAS